LRSIDDPWVESRFTTAFHIPVKTVTTIQGRSQTALLIPVETQLFPEVYLPGVPLITGPALGMIRYRGSPHRAKRIVECGRLFVDSLTGRLLRYLSMVTATIDDTTTVVLARSHVRFQYDGVASISLPAPNIPI
jgi:hypothetical protein